MNKQLDTKEEALVESKKALDALRNTLREKESEQNELLTNHTREILTQEKKHNEAVQTLFQETNALKQAHQAELAAKNEELANLDYTYKEKIAALRDESVELEGKLQQERFAKEEVTKAHQKELEALRQKTTTLEQEKEALRSQIKEIERIAQERVQQKDKEYAAALEEIKTHSLFSKERENELIATVEKQLEAQKIALKTAKDEQRVLQEEVTTLETSLAQANASHEEQLAQNEAKHAKNYASLNEKVVALERERAVIINKTTEHIDTLKTDHTTTLQAAQKNAEELEKELAVLKEKNENLRLSQDEQLLALKDDFEALQEEIKAREVAYEEKIEQLNTALIQEQNESQKLLTEAVLEKPELLASITCDDMESGTNAASADCQARVREFLNDYTASYFFEVVPVVDDGGFSTLKRVEADDRLGVPSEEIARLTRLSNLGLGKDRAASGGKLVESHFEGLARVSYSSEMVEAANKRGFVIRVYR
jgi:hypothetical protein